MAEPFRRSADGDGPPEAASPAPPDDPLIARWLRFLAEHPEATPQHRRFARWTRKLWHFYVRHPALWRGIVYLHVRSGEPCEIRGFDEGA